MAVEFRGPVDSVEVPKGNLVSYLFQESHRWNQLPAMICGLTDRTWTFAQFQQQMGRWGAWLTQRWGHFVPQQTVVGIMSEPSVEYALAQLGTMAVGGAVVHLYSSYTSHELAKQIINSNTSLIVVQAEFEAALRKSFEILGKPLPVVVVGHSQLSALALFGDIVNDEGITPMTPIKLIGDEVCILICTSGSTGLPKFVAHTHHQAALNTEMIIHPRYCNMQPPKDGLQTRFLTNRQTGLGFPFVCSLMPPLKLGVCQVVRPLDEVNLIRDIEHYKIKHIAVVPSIIPVLLASRETRPAVLDQLRGLIVSGAPLPSIYEDAIATALPEMTFQRGYGMSEILLTTMDPVTGGKAGYSGELLPGIRARVADVNTGKLLPAGRDGLIYMHTHCAMTCYLNNEAGTAEVLDSDGWINTGDVGHVDEDGFLRITDRIKEHLKVKGTMTVSPSEIENAILSHSCALEACVVGVPHPLDGLDIVYAFVVVKDNNKVGRHTEDEVPGLKEFYHISEEAIKEMMKEKLCEEKIPKRIIFLDAMPKNSSGKNDRTLLKKKTVEMERQ